LIGTNALFCLKSIPFLVLAPLAATLFYLQRGAVLVGNQIRT